MDAAALRQAATDFMAWDTCPQTRDEAQALLDSGDAAALGAAFDGRLEFGTAGLRGPMGAGFTRMNEVTVMQAAQGVAAYVLETAGAGAAVVVGFDHRARGAITSRRFALITAAACLAKGLKVHLFSRLTCTPLVPFSTVRLGAAAGVMVTASHNPAADNGYKLYGSNGSQIIAPVDKRIAALIAQHAAPWPEAGYAAAVDVGGAGEAALVERCSDPAGEMVPAYLAAVSGALCRHRGANGDASLARPGITYTAMHGVGTPYAAAMLEAFALPAFTRTAAQVEPDAAFPTVAYPNPEEGAGALALAMATADAAGDQLILANDPDADRLAVAEWVPEGGDGAWRKRAPGEAGGAWRVFTGNEIGALLAAWAWRCHVEAGGRGEGAVMLASTVSSKFLGAMARAEGFTFEETLTGFKWMGNQMAEHEAAGRTVLFSFEEAIGFACGTVVRDKDGVSAAAVCAEMAGVLAREGLTLAGQLKRLGDKYGHFVSNNGYLFVDAPAKTAAIFARLTNEGHYWAKLGGAGGPPLAITAIRDLRGPGGYDSERPGGVPGLPTSSGSYMITFKFSNGAVATLRTSGTEPKLKWYSELAGPDPAAARAELDRTVQLIVDEMLRPEVHGLKRPAIRK